MESTEDKIIEESQTKCNDEAENQDESDDADNPNCNNVTETDNTINTEETVIDEPGNTEETVIDEHVNTKENVIKEPGNTEETVIDEPGNTEETVIKEPGNTEETLINEPVNTEETVINEPVNTGETVINEPVNTGETVINEPVNTGETVINEPVNTGETVINEPVNTGETVINKPVDTGETLINEPVNTEGTLINELVNTEETLIDDPVNTENTVINELVNSEETVTDDQVNTENTVADGKVVTEEGKMVTVAVDDDLNKPESLSGENIQVNGDKNLRDSDATVINNQESGNEITQNEVESLDNDEGKGFDDSYTSNQEIESPQKSSLPSKIITVTVMKDGIQKEIKVEILQATCKKPFLGGFRHKLNKTEYLNASCQTYPKKVIPSKIEKFNRDTQTTTTKNQIQQTHNNTSTQMTKPGCYVSDVIDVTRVPGPYITADQLEKERLTKVILLQSYWRRWLASRYVDRIRKDLEFQIMWERREAERKAAEKAQRLQKEFERRMKPRTKADFDLLYAALERWRREETDRINEMHSGAERKAALTGLLEQETYLIQSIERHRFNADKENYTANVNAFLDKAAAPKLWRAYDGKITEMNTQNSLRAQELRDLYNSLQMTYLTQDERLDVLLTLKHTVKEHDCKLTQELMELIDREADLLTRGMKVANLEGLRLRISTLFLQFCKTPAFNPDVGRLLKVPQDPSKLRKDIYFCPSCNSYLPSKDFPLASNSRIVGRCKKCSQVDNNARLRNDFTKVRCIMQHLRRTEEALDDGSKTAFIIQDADLRYLIENIWNSQSALSGYDDLYDLVFIRWNKHEHWSPWNCVLLTKEEASAHMKLDSVFEAYGRIFIGKVHHRHVIAKQYFSGLKNVSEGLARNSSTIDTTRRSIGISS